jgi:hypothetical protein
MANRHVGKDPKNRPKMPTPLPVISGPVYTSTNQKKRYITIAGIVSDTSYQEHQWPEYSVKELADNSYDFFKIYYPNATANERKIEARVTIDTKQPINVIHIAVRNSNVNNFPVFQNLSGVFDYNNWGSTKRDQHRMTAGGLGDFLKRALGMGYASWTSGSGSSNNLEDSFEDKQWEEPVTLRFDGREYKAFIVVINGDIRSTRIEGPTQIRYKEAYPLSPSYPYTEVEVALPLSAYWNTCCDTLLDHLERYYYTFKLVKRNTDFSFTKEVV